MYVAVKSAERAIDNAHAWLAKAQRGDVAIPELSIAQIREQLALAVYRVMATGSLCDADMAALANKQARRQLIEAGLVRDLRLSAIIVTHNLAVVLLLADGLVIMRDGGMVKAGLTDQALDGPQQTHTQLLVSSVLQV